MWRRFLLFKDGCYLGNIEFATIVGFRTSLGRHFGDIFRGRRENRWVEKVNDLMWKYAAGDAIWWKNCWAFGFDSRLDIRTERFVTLLARVIFRELTFLWNKRHIIDDLYAKSPRVSLWITRVVCEENALSVSVNPSNVDWKIHK